MLTERSRRWLKFLLAISVSILFSFLFIRGIDLREVWSALTAANYLLVGPALGLFALAMVARAVRWELTYRPHRTVDWRRLVPSLLVGYAGNNLLPLRAGELLRAQHLADRENVPRMLTFGTYMMERLFDGMVLVTALMWGLLLMDMERAIVGAGVVLACLTMFGFTLCVYLANHPQLPARLMSRKWPLLSDRVRHEIGSLGESFITGFSALKDRRLFAAVAVATVASWLLEFGMYWVISMAFDLGAGFMTIAFAGAAANVALSVPSAQGGVGPFQVAAKESLVRFGIDVSPAAAYAIALHIFLVAPVSLLGLLVLWRSALPVRAVATPLGPARAETD